MSQREREQIIELAARLGVVATEFQAELLLEHLSAVLAANEHLNLTAITDRASAIRLHVIDSLALVPHVRSAGDAIVDIGTGAGYPGVPLSIVSLRPVDMVESVKKKARFLEECVRSLGGLSGSEVFPIRVEEAAHARPGLYGCVTARALSALPSLVELASPLLCVGGHLLAMKGSPTAREMEAGRTAAASVGMEESQVVEYVLPDSGEFRTVIRYTKIGRPTVPLPRRIGLAQKRPFG
ncbi:MAG: 16S rRNA (guanine(527)-N(7))-methyltransferase RsmG [Anaerosomatales bacterium]|nr:16S rRNA (guanine(527)-N(7))-methyltransferase RsmG [Anaerosomatales bacterium]